MDFIGYGKVDPETKFFIAESLQCWEVLLYDQRFRGVFRENGVLSYAMGLSETATDSSSKRPSHPKHDEIEELTSLYNFYLSIEPQYVLMSDNTMCDQRKESFDQWLGSRISAVKGGAAISFSTTRQVSLRLPKSCHVCDESLAQENAHVRMFHFFVDVPTHLDACADIPIPVVCESFRWKRICDEWLAVMSWWKKVVKELGFTTAMLQELSADAAMDAESKAKVAEKLTRKLRRVLKHCREQEREIPLGAGDGAAHRHRHHHESGDFLPEPDDRQDAVQEATLRKQFPRAGDVDLLEDLLLLSVMIVHHVVTYLVNVQRKQAGHAEYDSAHRDALAHDFRVFHGKIRNHYSRKRRVCNDVVQTFVSRVLQHTAETLVKGRDEVRRRPGAPDPLPSATALVSRLMSGVGAVALDALYENYRMKVRREVAQQALERYCRQVARSTEDRLRVVTPHFYAALVSLVLPVVEACVPVLKQPAPVSEMVLPLAVVHDDFPLFLKEFPHMFDVCPHPLTDMYGHTQGRTLAFMIGLLDELKQSRGVIRDLFRLAEAAVKLYK